MDDFKRLLEDLLERGEVLQGLTETEFNRGRLEENKLITVAVQQIVINNI